MTLNINQFKSGFMILTGAVLLSLVGCQPKPTIEVMEETVTTATEAGPETDLSEAVAAAEAEVVEDVVYDFTSFDQVQATRSTAYFDRDKIKGIYLTGSTAGGDRLADLVEIADTTEINAFVIDVKSDDGRVTFDTDIAEVDEIGSEYTYIKDIDRVMDTLYEHDIYPIARIVVFKDPYLAKHKSEYAIKNTDGSLWYYKKIAWLNPYNRDCWHYIVEVAKEAAKAGFKEIQFDYIRFEATSTLKHASFDGLENGLDRQQIILEFVDYAMEELEPYGVEVSADVFGTVITSQTDAERIGQDYVEMAHRLDVICPMIYPSHYGYGFYGTPAGQHSDLYPYRIIKGSMDDSAEVLATLPEDEPRAVVRPWLQAFTASYLGEGNYMVYGKQALRDQIQATYDAGLEEWILWNAGNWYKTSYLLPEEENKAED